MTIQQTREIMIVRSVASTAGMATRYMMGGRAMSGVVVTGEDVRDGEMVGGEKEVEEEGDGGRDVKVGV